MSPLNLKVFQKFEPEQPVTGVSAVVLPVRFSLNLTIQTLVCSLSVGIVPIPQHTQNITRNTVK